MKLELNVPEQVVEAICVLKKKPEEQAAEEFVTNIVTNTLRLFFVEYKKKQMDAEVLQKHVDEANALSFEGK